MFKRILIANRGEIAVRVIRACRELGIESVAVYSEADRAALHVREADYAYPVGPAPARESYLNIEKILDAAKRDRRRRDSSRLRLLLRERAASRAPSQQAGITFIGPPPDAIDAMGDKVEARKLMAAAGRAGRARLARTRWRPRQQVARDRQKDRLPDHAQGGGRRRRQGHAPGRERQGPRVGRPHASRARPSRRSATAASTSRNFVTQAAPHRGAGVRRPRTATPSTCSSANARFSAAIRRSSRNRPRRSSRPRCAREMGEVAVRAAQGGELRRRRHDRVPGRRRPQLLLPRDEHAHPGRASGDRAGDRRRPGAHADRGRRRREAAVQARGPGAARMGDRMPHLRRGSGGRLRARAGKDRDAADFPTAPACATTPASTRAPKSRSSTIR